MSRQDAAGRSRARLSARDVTLGYGDRVVVDGLSLDIPDRRVTMIVGPNACGKSTLLRALGRVLRPRSGAVVLDGSAISTLPTQEVARRLALLPQTPQVPEGLTVRDLVARGRSPHQRFLRALSQADEAVMERALVAADVVDFADRPVDELSGGQRQRAWLAMALAQDTDLLLLDEPTTFLDIAHQVDVLHLVRRLNREHGRTVVAVLHDLNFAARYADHVVAMRQGRIVAAGRPAAVVTPETVASVFGLDVVVLRDPVTGTPLVVPAADPPSGPDGPIGEA